MIIIADSGSTKTDWCVVNHGKQIKRITTEGTNPFFQTEEEISQVVKDKLMPHLVNWLISVRNHTMRESLQPDC